LSHIYVVIILTHCGFICLQTKFVFAYLVSLKILNGTNVLPWPHINVFDINLTQRSNQVNRSIGRNSSLKEPESKKGQPLPNCTGRQLTVDFSYIY